MKRLASLLALMIMGCTVGPDYERPSLEVPETFRGAEVGTEADVT